MKATNGSIFRKLNADCNEYLYISTQQRKQQEILPCRIFYIESGTESFYLIAHIQEGVAFIHHFLKYSEIIPYWLQKEIAECNLKLWEAIKLFSIAFTIFYIAGCGFNGVTQLLT